MEVLDWNGVIVLVHVFMRPDVCSSRELIIASTFLFNDQILSQCGLDSA